jgi:hypothetical protein
VNGALEQVRGTMATGYQLDVAKGRLHMACALARRALESLDSQIEVMSSQL